MTDIDTIADVIAAAVRVSTKQMADSQAAMSAQMGALQAMQATHGAMLTQLSTDMAACLTRMTACEQQMAEMMADDSAEDQTDPADATEMANLRADLITLKSAIESLPVPRDGKDGTSVDVDELSGLIQRKIDTSVLREDMHHLSGEVVTLTRSMQALPAVEASVPVLTERVIRIEHGLSASTGRIADVEIKAALMPSLERDLRLAQRRLDDTELRMSSDTVASEDVIKVFTEALAHELERLEVQTAQSS